MANYILNSKQISSIINGKKDAIFLLYSFENGIEENFSTILTEVLTKHNMEQSITPIFSCLKELISNGIKGNIKTILIQESIVNKNFTERDLVRFKQVLNEQTITTYTQKCYENRLSTRIYFHVTEKELRIDVINNSPVDSSTFERMISKKRMALNYDSIAQFFLDNPDPLAEGSGLGLSLTTVLLKGIGLNESSLELDTDFIKKTRASLIIPLN